MLQSSVNFTSRLFKKKESRLRRKFMKNKIALLGSILLIMLYAITFSGEFVAPYDAEERSDYRYAPPQRVRFITQDGRLSRPFVYRLEQKRDPQTFRLIYSANPQKVDPIRFFVQGKKYRLFGLIPTEIRLLGVDDGGTLFLLGADRFGRDLSARIIAGGKISLLLPVLGMLISAILGSIIGLISGYYGGIMDNIIQRIVELVVSFPRIPLWMAIAAALPAEMPPLHVFVAMTMVLAVIGWAPLARQVRGKTLAVREEQYIMAAKSVGTSDRRIVLRHILPNVLTHVIVVATLLIPGFILAESSLSFLGIGITPPLISWGVLLREAQNVRSLIQAPWLVIPGAAIIMTMLAFNFVGDGVRDTFDPHAQ